MPDRICRMFYRVLELYEMSPRKGISPKPKILLRKEKWCYFRGLYKIINFLQNRLKISSKAIFSNWNFKSSLYLLPKIPKFCLEVS